jgi:hypothetical protein
MYAPEVWKKSQQYESTIIINNHKVSPISTERAFKNMGIPTFVAPLIVFEATPIETHDLRHQ